MWGDIRTVFWLEYRRHLRSRVFWWILLLMTGANLAVSAGFAYLISLLGGLRGTAEAFTVIGLVLLGLLGTVATFASPLVVPRIFSDLYKTRELHDIYLTNLHPLAIVIGRVLTASVQVGLILLTLFPAGVLTCQIAGFPANYWFLVLVITWGVQVMIIALCVQQMYKRFPADGAGALRGGLTKGWEVVGWLFFISIVLLGWNLLVGGGTHLPAYLLLPLLVPFEVLERVSLGSWEIPSWLLAVPMMVGITLLAFVSSAQWLGWWSDVVYRSQRLAGTGLFLLIFVGNLALYTQVGVSSLAEAQRVVFWGMAIGAFAYFSFFARLLGYYGMGVRVRKQRFALAPPLSGIVWEWVLFVLVAISTWLTVGAVSGYWVEPVRWLVWSGTMISIFVLAQAVNAKVFTFYWYWLRQPPDGSRLVNSSEVRAYLEMLGTRTVAVVFWILVLLSVISGVLALFPLQSLKTIGSTLSLLNPLSGVNSHLYNLNHYLGYMTYTLFLALLFGLHGIREGRIWFHSLQQASSDLEEQKV